MAKTKRGAEQEASAGKEQKRRGPQPALNAAQVRELAKKYRRLMKQAQEQVDRAAVLLEACEAAGASAVIHPATSGIESGLIKLVKQTHWFESMATIAARENGLDPAAID